MTVEEIVTPPKGTQPSPPQVIDQGESLQQQGLEPRWLMPVLDIVLVLVAFLLAYYVRYDLQVLRPLLEQNNAPFEPYIGYAFFFAVWVYINYRGNKLYKLVRGRALMEEVYIIINGVTNATVILTAVSFFLQPKVFSRLMLVYAAGFTVILLVMTRIGQRSWRAYLRAKGIGVQRVLLVGIGDVGQSVLRVMIARKELGYAPVGFLDDNPSRAHADLGRVLALGEPEKLSEIIHDYNVNLVVIALDWSQHDRIVDLVWQARNVGADVRVVPDLFQLNMKQVQVENLDGVPLLGVSGKVEFQRVNRVIKRMIDLGLIALGSPILVPIFLLVALAIFIEGSGSVLYKQRRVGQDGREFNMIKFRSMIPDADKYRQKLVQDHQLDPRHPKIPDDPRITRVGRLIRRTSLDELPNIINVVLGHMSIVGPRPPTPDEVELYEPWHMQRLQIMPGITGLWQVNGRSDVPFEEMVLLDIYYIENWSIKLDLQILLMTLPRVLLRHGAY